MNEEGDDEERAGAFVTSSENNTSSDSNNSDSDGKPGSDYDGKTGSDSEEKLSARDDDEEEEDPPPDDEDKEAEVEERGHRRKPTAAAAAPAPEKHQRPVNRRSDARKRKIESLGDRVQEEVSRQQFLSENNTRLKAELNGVLEEVIQATYPIADPAFIAGLIGGPMLGQQPPSAIDVVSLSSLTPVQLTQLMALLHQQQQQNNNNPR